MRKCGPSVRRAREGAAGPRHTLLCGSGGKAAQGDVWGCAAQGPRAQLRLPRPIPRRRGPLPLPFLNLARAGPAAAGSGAALLDGAGRRPDSPAGNGGTVVVVVGGACSRTCGLAADRPPCLPRLHALCGAQAFQAVRRRQWAGTPCGIGRGAARGLCCRAVAAAGRGELRREFRAPKSRQRDDSESDSESGPCGQARR